MQPDGKLASQQTGKVFIDCGPAPFDLDKENELLITLLKLLPRPLASQLRRMAPQDFDPPGVIDFLDDVRNIHRISHPFVKHLSNPFCLIKVDVFKRIYNSEKRIAWVFEVLNGGAEDPLTC